MFVVFLKFSTNKDQAAQHMDGHKAWLQQGFDDGVFALAGGLQSKQGGAIIAFGLSHEDLVTRVNEDPFVAEGVVSPEIFEISPTRMDDRLKFLNE